MTLLWILLRKVNLYSTNNAVISLNNNSSSRLLIIIRNNFNNKNHNIHNLIIDWINLFELYILEYNKIYIIEIKIKE